MRYMVVERFKSGSAKAIYERVRERGRMLPDGLEYVDGWVSAKLDMCFQLMNCDDEELFAEWYLWTQIPHGDAQEWGDPIPRIGAPAQFEHGCPASCGLRSPGSASQL